MSACSDSQSTILPLPSSPHWAPTTTTFAMNDLSQPRTAPQPKRNKAKPRAWTEALRELTDAAPRRQGQRRCSDARRISQPPDFSGLYGSRFWFPEQPGSWLSPRAAPRRNDGAEGRPAARLTGKSSHRGHARARLARTGTAGVGQGAAFLWETERPPGKNERE